MPDVEYEGDKPAWLDEWPTKQEIQARFPLGLRNVGSRMYLSERRLSLTWTERSLNATVGQQHVKWRHDDRQGWVITCTCGSPTPNCLHGYIADLMLRAVCCTEDWQMPGQECAPSAAAAPPQVTLPPRFAAATPPHPTPQRQMTMNFGSVFSGASAPVTPPQPPQHLPVTLDVELDFNVSQVSIGVRFYIRSEDKREVQTLATMRNIAFVYSNGRQSGRYSFSEKDSAFLKNLYISLVKLPFARLDGNCLRLSRAEFKDWLRQWGKEPGRFIERSSHKPFVCDCVTPKSLQFELCERGKFFSVAAVYILDDAAGTRCHFSRMLDKIAGDASGFLVREKLDAFQCPVSFEHLRNYFSEGNYGINRYNGCEMLYKIACGHLELIAPGPCVRVVHKVPEKISVEAYINKDGDFQVELKGLECRRHSDQPNAPVTDLSYENGKFRINIYSKPQKEDDFDVEATLARLGKLSNSRYDDMKNGIFRFFSHSVGAKHLYDAWTSLPDSVEKHVCPELKRMLENPVAPQLRLKANGNGNFAELQVDCTFDGVSVSSSDLRRALAQNEQFLQLSNGSWFKLDEAEVRRIMSEMNRLGLDGNRKLMFKKEAQDFLEDFAEKEGGHLMQLEGSSVPFVQRLLAEHFPQQPKVPEHFMNALRPYQLAGVDFMSQRCVYNVGAILADDMGLGKTLQALALLESWAGNKPDFRALVVTPASVIDVWLDQIARFGVRLSAAALRGTKPQRKKILEDNAFQILVTHYGIVRMDIDTLQARNFDFVVLDEAQAIKNPESQVSGAVRSLKAEKRIAMTGTPLENSLIDLWSIMDFLNPGLMGNSGDFVADYVNGSGLGQLRRRLEMLMLRRPKSLVAKELPPKTEEVLSLDMPDEMRKAYVLEVMEAKQRSTLGGFGQILAALTRLRRFCCAPELLGEAFAKCQSPKLDYLQERLDELLAGGHSVLVFSQFTTLLEHVARRLDAKGNIPYFTITGETPIKDRGEIVRRFEELDKPSVFLLSLKAAGTGLTLTRADYVFLLDPWWNPAAENQAIDRTHRIGQDKPVFAYKLIMRNSVEEKVMAIIEAKRQLFANVIEEADANGNDSRLTLEELRSLL